MQESFARLHAGIEYLDLGPFFVLLLGNAVFFSSPAIWLCIKFERFSTCFAVLRFCLASTTHFLNLMFFPPCWTLWSEYLRMNFLQLKLLKLLFENVSVPNASQVRIPSADPWYYMRASKIRLKLQKDPVGIRIAPHKKVFRNADQSPFWRALT